MMSSLRGGRVAKAAVLVELGGPLPCLLRDAAHRRPRSVIAQCVGELSARTAALGSDQCGPDNYDTALVFGVFSRCVILALMLYSAVFYNGVCWRQ